MVSPPGLDPDDLAAPGHAEALLGRLVALHLRHGRQSPAGGGAGGASSGAAPRGRRRPGAMALGLGGRGDQEPHRLPLEKGLALDGAVLADLLGELEEQIAAQVGMCQLASAEATRDLDPVAVLQELGGAADLGIEIPLAYVLAEAYLLKLDRPLVAAGLLLTARLLVFVLAVGEQGGGARGGRGGQPPR